MRVALDDLVHLLDTTLDNTAFRDASHNGLQIANNGHVTRVVAGVDANLKLMQAAAAYGADCIVCHHGLSWGNSLARVTGLNHRLLSFALEHNIAVYASHLPLDAHPRYGNNAQLCQALDLVDLTPAFQYHDQTIGMIGYTGAPLTSQEFVERIRRHINPQPHFMPFGKTMVHKIGVVSGGAADLAAEADALGVDLFLTGETSLVGYTLAEHLELNLVFAGHYATETFGVRALAHLIQQKLGLPAELIDFKVPF